MAPAPTTARGGGDVHAGMISGQIFFRRPPSGWVALAAASERFGTMNTAEEALLQQRTEGKRLVQFDSLRGIAALLVVAHHVRLMQHGYLLPWYLVPFFSGSQAVVLFFVLSGYVLSLPSWRGKHVPFPTYALRRCVRIYLPFAAAALVSITGALLFHGYHLPLTHAYQEVWHTPVTARTIVAQLLMWPFAIFNLSFWSLRYEMQLSLLMPGIVWLLRRFPPYLVLGTSLLFGFASIGLITRLDRFHLAGQTVQIGSLFVLGAVLAREQAKLSSVVRRFGAGGWALLACSLLLYFNYPARLPPGRLQAVLADRSMLTSAVGASGILVCALTLPAFSSSLRAGATEYLGRISYSLYLIHSVIIVATLDLLFGRIAQPALLLVTGLACWSVAHGFSWAVEEPCARLSRRVSFPRVHRELPGAGRPGMVGDSSGR